MKEVDGERERERGKVDGRRTVKETKEVRAKCALCARRATGRNGGVHLRTQ